MCQAAGIKRKTAHCFRVTRASNLFNASVASKLIFDRTVSGEVEKVSRRLDMYTTPVCFGDFNNLAFMLFEMYCLAIVYLRQRKVIDSCLAMFE